MLSIVESVPPSRGFDPPTLRKWTASMPRHFSMNSDPAISDIRLSRFDLEKPIEQLIP